MRNWLKKIFGSSRTEEKNEIDVETAHTRQDEVSPLYRVRCPKCFEFHFVKAPGLYACPARSDQQFEARLSDDSNDFLTGFTVGSLVSGNLGGGLLGGWFGGVTGGFVGGALASHSNSKSNSSNDDNDDQRTSWYPSATNNIANSRQDTETRCVDSASYSNHSETSSTEDSSSFDD